jgi:hypothetical protein
VAVKSFSRKNERPCAAEAESISTPTLTMALWDLLLVLASKKDSKGSVSQKNQRLRRH